MARHSQAMGEVCVAALLMDSLVWNHSTSSEIPPGCGCVEEQCCVSVGDPVKA